MGDGAAMKRLLLGLLLSTLLGAQVGPLPGAGPFMPMEVVTSGCVPAVTNIGTNSNTTGATLTLTGVTVPAGSLIIVIVDENGSNVALGSVADGVNTYSSAGSTFGKIFFAANASLSGGTITYTKNVSGDTATISAAYATGVATVSPLDAAVTATATGSGTSPSVTSGTPGQSGELFIGMVSPLATSGSITMTQDAGHGWSFPPNFVDTTVTAVGGGNQVNAGTGTKIFAPTLTGTSITWDAGVFGFKHC